MLHERALLIAHRRSQVLDVEGFAGRWVNAEGSILDLQVDGHEVSGTFAHVVGDDGHHIANVHGYATGGLLALIAFYQNIGALSTWSGVISGHEFDCLKLAWRMIYEAPEPEKEDEYWAADHHGSEEFRRH